MPPVVAFVGTLLTTGSFLAAGTAFTAAGIAAGFASGFAALGAWALTQAVIFGISMLLAPKQRTPERQADTLQLSLSENPREVLFGHAATGGQLVNAGNFDSGSGSASKNRSEWLCIKISDVRCHSLVGFWANDEYIAFSADGDQVSTGIPLGGLKVWWRDGRPGQTPPATLVAASGGVLTSDMTMTGCAHVYVEYRDNKNRTIWPSGRPRFLWVVKGALMYDPRKDSTVPGGSGDHRWGDEDTYEWSENAYIARYNYVRGFYNRGGATPHLMVGRGLTAIEAPPERAIARANICDEDVALK